jgi:hypothetical protein
VKLKKTLKTLTSGQKNPKKPKKIQKNPKNPTGLGLKKKKRVFSNPGYNGGKKKRRRLVTWGKGRLGYVALNTYQF